ncbi:MAG: hypothetical protein M4579_003246 [Chaenotheca gracillima]|nr:MAG: hypothetical protein M4579_003246 [Chaenotheca gracillima]
MQGKDVGEQLVEAAVARFEVRNFDYIRNLLEETGYDCEWEELPDGACHAFFSADAFERAKKVVRELAPDLARHARIVEDKSELAEFRVPKAIGAIMQRPAAKLSPYKLISQLLVGLIKEEGLNLQTNTPVKSLTAEPESDKRGWTVETPRGTIRARNVLCATNGYTSHLIPQMETLIVPVRGEMSALKPPAALLERPFTCSYELIGAVGQDETLDDYLMQRPVSEGGQLMFGGGRLLAREEGIDVDDDEKVDEPVAEYLRSLPAFMDLGFGKEIEPLEAEAEWTGVMGYSRDDLPWIGGVPGMEGVFLSAGYAGHGMPNGALSGQHAAELVVAALKSEGSKGWRDYERHAVEQGRIPESYVISSERMTAARQKPRLQPKYRVKWGEEHLAKILGR